MPVTAYRPPLQPSRNVGAQGPPCRKTTTAPSRLARQRVGPHAAPPACYAKSRPSLTSQRRHLRRRETPRHHHSPPPKPWPLPIPPRVTPKRGPPRLYDGWQTALPGLTVPPKQDMLSNGDDQLKRFVGVNKRAALDVRNPT